MTRGEVVRAVTASFGAGLAATLVCFIGLSAAFGLGRSPLAPQQVFGLACYVAQPISLFAGAMVSGYLSSRTVPSFGLRLLTVVGLYLPPLQLLAARRDPQYLQLMALPSVIWIGSSLLGFLGGHLVGRAKRLGHADRD